MAKNRERNVSPKQRVLRPASLYLHRDATAVIYTFKRLNTAFATVAGHDIKL